MCCSNVITILKANNLSYARMYEALDSSTITNNSTAERNTIRNENMGIAGIYCWENKLNNNAYVGRSRNLGKRLNSYFIPSNLVQALSRGESLISRAILNHGVGNFRLFVLEVVHNYNDKRLSDREYLSYLEGVWVGTLKSAYNIAGTGIEYAHNAPSASNTAARKAAALRYKRTTLIDCYDYKTNKYLFTFEGVRALVLASAASRGHASLARSYGPRPRGAAGGPPKLFIKYRVQYGII